MVHFVHLNFCIALLCGLASFLTIAPVGVTQSEVRMYVTMHTICMYSVQYGILYVAYYVYASEQKYQIMQLSCSPPSFLHI